MILLLGTHDEKGLLIYVSRESPSYKHLAIKPINFGDISFYNKGHQNLLTVITLRLAKLTKLSLTDKLRTPVVTCMAHRCMQNSDNCLH